VDWRKYITTDPEVAHGQACFVGTRIPVSVVLDNLAASNSPKEVLKSYPSLRDRAQITYTISLDAACSEM
jgi:uncharacterized protein (DUF433 family)